MQERWKDCLIGLFPVISDNDLLFQRKFRVARGGWKKCSGKSEQNVNH